MTVSPFLTAFFLFHHLTSSDKAEIASFSECGFKRKMPRQKPHQCSQCCVFSSLQPLAAGCFCFNRMYLPCKLGSESQTINSQSLIVTFGFDELLQIPGRSYVPQWASITDPSPCSDSCLPLPSLGGEAGVPACGPSVLLVSTEAPR